MGPGPGDRISHGAGAAGHTASAGEPISPMLTVNRQPSFNFQALGNSMMLLKVNLLSQPSGKLDPGASTQSCEQWSLGRSRASAAVSLSDYGE
jgi:hypothetical protein